MCRLAVAMTDFLQVGRLASSHRVYDVRERRDYYIISKWQMQRSICNINIARSFIRRLSRWAAHKSFKGTVLCVARPTFRKAICCKLKFSAFLAMTFVSFAADAVSSGEEFAVGQRCCKQNDQFELHSY